MAKVLSALSSAWGVVVFVKDAAVAAYGVYAGYVERYPRVVAALLLVLAVTSFVRV